jgi:hypothetical protein
VAQTIRVIRSHPHRMTPPTSSVFLNIPNIITHYVYKVNNKKHTPLRVCFLLFV